MACCEGPRSWKAEHKSTPAGDCPVVRAGCPFAPSRLGVDQDRRRANLPTGYSVAPSACVPPGGHVHDASVRSSDPPEATVGVLPRPCQCRRPGDLCDLVSSQLDGGDYGVV